MVLVLILFRDGGVKSSMLCHSRLRGNDGIQTIWIFTNPSIHNEVQPTNHSNYIK